MYKQLHAIKRDNLEETDKFLERYNLPRLSQKEKQNMNYTKYQNWYWISRKTPNKQKFRTIWLLKQILSNI